MIKDYLDISIFGLFLIANLVLGLLAGRRVKSLRDFSIGNKTFSTGTATSTIISTWISGGFMFYTLQNIYTTGLRFLFVIIPGSLCLLIMGQVLAVRMGEFLNNLSLAEAMGDLYDKNVRILTAITGIVKTVGQVAVQFKVIAKMLAFLLGIEGPWISAVAAGIVILYSAFGGIRSVTITDIFQFIAFSAFVPILALIIWNNLKNPSEVATILHTSPLFSWKANFGWDTKTLSTLGLLLYFALPTISPPVFQRIAISRDIKQVKESFTYSAGIMLLIILGVAWIAILLLADPSVQDPKNLMGHLINHYAYPGLKGFIAIGIVAMAMSTADSNLNAASVLTVNDIIKLAKPTWQNTMLIVRLASIALGVCGLLLALSMQNILDLLLFSASFYVPIVVAPFLLAIFGFRSKPRPVLIGMSAGFISVILWSIFFKNSDSIIPGMLANLIFFMGSHYLLKEKGGWTGIRDKEPLLAARQRRREAWISLIHTIKSSNIYAYLHKNLPGRESVYALTAIYILLSTYLGFYFLKEDVTVQFPRLERIVFHSVLIIVAILLTYPIWNEFFKNKRWLMIAIWYVSVVYVFFFLSSLLVLFSGLQQEFLFAFISNLIIASFLLPSPVFISMLLFALPLSWVAFKAITGVTTFPMAFSLWQFKLMYMWMLVGSSLVVIFNIRSKYVREKATTRRLHLERLETELKAKIFNVLQSKTSVYQTELNFAYAGRDLLFNKIAEVLDQLKEKLEQFYRLPINTILNEQLVIQYWTEVFAKFDWDIQRLTEKSSLILTKPTSIQLINQALNNYQASAGRYAEVVVKPLTTSKKIECDVEKLGLLISNTLRRAQAHNTRRKPLILRLEDTVLVYKIDHTRMQELREKAIKIIVTTFSKPMDDQNSYVAYPNGGVDDTIRSSILEPVLLENISIVDIHYGYMGEEIRTDTDYHQFYVLPIKLSRFIKSRRLLDQWMPALGK